MIPLKVFTFSPFQENTYLLTASNRDTLVFDPGCFYPDEEEKLLKYIRENNLNITRLINTHAHIDHVFGNALVHRHFGVFPELHELELSMLTMAPSICEAYGIQMPAPSPVPEHFLQEGESVVLGEYEMTALFTPGHSAGSLSFYCASYGFLIAGDVLFRESIGRTDLPGGDYDTLIRSVKEKLFSLPDDTVVHSGHGPKTTIGYEKRNNPFFQ
jgi:glyoxylase-like metal-dependent hydrolase (beta-lactamase superfamily II)